MAEDTSTSPSPGAAGTGVRTFLLADLRGYTRYTQDHGDDAASHLAARFAEVVRTTMPEFAGELLELRGDEALCVFGSARQALRAAVELQRQFRSPVRVGSALPLGVGMGLDAGEAVPTEGGFRGAALNMAGRLCGAASGGEILCTERLVRLTGPIPGLHWSRPRPMRLKGLRDPERIVSVESDEPIPPAPAPSREPSRQYPRRLVLVAVLVLLVAAVAVAVLRGGGGTTGGPSVATPARSVAVIDPGQNRVVDDIRLPAVPESMTAGAGQLWVGSGQQTETVTPVSLRSRRAGQPIGLGIDPAFLTYGQGAVWAYDGLSRIAEIDAQHASEIGQPRRFRKCTANHFAHPEQPSCAGGGIAIVGNEIWVGTVRGPYGEIDRLDSTSLKVISVIPRVDVGGALSQGLGEVWVWGNVGRSVDQVSVSGHRVTQRTDLEVAATYTGGGIAVSPSYAWIAQPAGNLFAFAAGDSRFTYKWRLPHGLTCVAATPHAIWVGVTDGRVLRVDPFSGKIVHQVHLGHVTPVALSYVDNRIWVALSSD